MKDISLIKGSQEGISNENIVNKIQDIVWDDIFEQYFLHPKVFNKTMYNKLLLNTIISNFFYWYTSNIYSSLQ